METAKRFTRSHKSATHLYRIAMNNLQFLSKRHETGQDLDVDTLREAIECLNEILEDSMEFSSKEAAVKAGY